MSAPSTTVSRRRVAHGAAWAVPIIAVGAAAPAMAASPCPGFAITWTGFATGAVPPQPRPSTPTGAPSMSWAASGTTSWPGNLRVNNTPDGGLSTPYLEIGLPGGGTFNQTVTFTLDAPVTNLTVTIGDIDSSGGATPSFHEGVYLTPGFTTDFRGALLSGTGLAGDPWQGPLGTSIGAGSNAGNAVVTYAGPIASFSLTLLDLIPSIAAAGGHSIDFFALTFDYCGAGGGGETGGGCPDDDPNCGGG